MNRAALRDLLLLVIGGVIAPLTAIASTRGLFHITLNDLEQLAGSVLGSVSVWFVAYATPVTKRYGVGWSSDSSTPSDQPKPPVTP